MASSNEPSSSMAPESHNIYPTEGKGRKRKRHYSGSLWPKRVKKEQANVITAGIRNDWSTVELIGIGDYQYPFMEYHEAKYTLLLSHGTLTITDANGVQLEVPCDGEVDYNKARLLYTSASMVKSASSVVIHQVQLPSKGPPDEPDSDDECIPDVARTPPFVDSALTNATILLNTLRYYFNVGSEVGFHNSVGKFLVEALGNYAKGILYPEEQYKSLVSTSTGETQPGASFVKWSLPKRKTRTTDSSDDTDITAEKYADHVLYDLTNMMNIVVTEVKVDSDSPSTAQNNEQMIGLWSVDQKAMLGLEVSSDTIRVKMLIQHNNAMKMYYFPEKSMDPSTMVELTKLFIAFLTIVNH